MPFLATNPTQKKIHNYLKLKGLKKYNIIQNYYDEK